MAEYYHLYNMIHFNFIKTYVQTFYLYYFMQPGSPSQAQPYIVQQSLFNNTVSKKKDPPRYEEAIKQTRNIQTSHREVVIFACLVC